MQFGVGARMQEDTAAREQLQTRGGRKNNKALIKADNLNGLLGYPTSFGLGGTHHVVSRSVRLGRGPPWPYTHGPVRTADDMHEEDSTRLGDQDEDSSPPAYLTRTLVILGLWCII